MDSDALYHVKQLFWQGAYAACIQEASEGGLTDLSDEENLSRALYVARSHLASSPPSTSSALSALAPALDAREVPSSVKAVKAFAEYVDAEDKDEKLEELRDLTLEYDGEEVDESTREQERIVRVMAATAFVLQGETEEAVTTLTEGCGKTDLECTALLVQLLLSIDRRDLAQTTYTAAKKWGEDSLLIQMMEAWIGMKSGGRSLQQSYYFYEELLQMPSGRVTTNLAPHAAAHYLLGHVDEAKADIIEALQKSEAKKDIHVLSVGATLGLADCKDTLLSSTAAHPMIADLKEKATAFDEAAAKFAVAA